MEEEKRLNPVGVFLTGVLIGALGMFIKIQGGRMNPNLNKKSIQYDETYDKQNNKRNNEYDPHNDYTGYRRF